MSIKSNKMIIVTSLLWNYRSAVDDIHKSGWWQTVPSQQDTDVSTVIHHMLSYHYYEYYSQFCFSCNNQ